MLELREYQQAAIDEVLTRFKGSQPGFDDKLLLVAPTGAGKTVMAAALCQLAVKYGRHLLFLVDRVDLIDQTISSLREKAKLPETSFGVVQASRPERRSACIQVATCQTAKSRSWIEKDWIPHLVILDEAHTTAFARGVQKLLDGLSSAKVLGMTATPVCLNKKRWLGQRFNGLVETKTPKQLQEMGFLVPAKYFTTGDPPDLSEITIGADGEWSGDALQIACNTFEMIFDAILWWEKLAKGQRTIGFCVSVEHAEAVAEFARDRGHKVEIVTGETPRKRRKVFYHRLKKGTIDILLSVGVLTTGFDEPSAVCALCLRPTQSLALWFQMVGRVLRISPATGKTHAIVIDQGGNVERHGLPEMVTGYSLGKDTNPISLSGELAACPRCGNYSENPRTCDNCGFDFSLSDSLPQSSKVGDRSVSGIARFGFTEIEIPTEIDVNRQKFRKLAKQAYSKGFNPLWARYKFLEKIDGGKELISDSWWLGAMTGWNDGDRTDEEIRQLFFECYRNLSKVRDKQARKGRPDKALVDRHIFLEFGTNSRSTKLYDLALRATRAS